MIDDPFRAERLVSATVPVDRWFAVTPNDDEDLAVKPRLISVSGAGVVRAVDADGVACDFTFAAGQSLPISPTRILETGTTATGIVAAY